MKNIYSFAIILSIASLLILFINKGDKKERHNEFIKLTAKKIYKSNPLKQAKKEYAARVTHFWSGALTSTSIKVNAITDAEADVRLIVSMQSNLSNPIYSTSQAANETNHYTVSLSVSGLSPSTNYYYGFELNGSTYNAQGVFSTIKVNEPYSFTFAVSACASTGSDHEVFDSIRKSYPKFYINTGDLFYSDITTNDAALFREAYKATLAAPRQADLYKNVPIVYTWDDHDYGANNSNASSASKPAAIEAYKAMVPHYPFANNSGPIYQSFTVGRIRFIVTDLRSEKIRGDSPTMMGAVQLAWFKEELLNAKRKNHMVCWVSSVAYIGTETDDNDSWAGFQEERQEIADFIEANRINKIFIICGDAHMLAFDDGTNSDFSTSQKGVKIPVFQAAALDRSGSEKGGPYSHGSFPKSGQFGLVEVNDTGNEVCIRFRGRREELTEDLISYNHCTNLISANAKKKQKKALDIKISPNPVIDGNVVKVEFEISQTTMLSLQLINDTGNVVYQDSQMVTAGFITKEIVLDNPSPGTYLLHIQTGTEKQSKKIVIL